jgi:hypothetical protein
MQISSTSLPGADRGRQLLQYGVRIRGQTGVDDERQVLVLDPQVRFLRQAGQQPGQVLPELVQAGRDPRHAQFTALPALGAVRAVDDQARYAGKAAEPEQRRHVPAGHHGDRCPGGPQLAQQRIGARQRARIFRVQLQRGQAAVEVQRHQGRRQRRT